LVAVGGPVAIVLGVLFLCPPAIRILAPAARRLPVAPRLALRDLTRYQARAGGALAAISLGLGIACTAIIATAASEPPSSAGNLSSHQLLFRLSPDAFVLPEPMDSSALQRLEEAISGFASAAGAEVYPLDAAVAREPATGGKPVIREPASGSAGAPVVVVGDRVPGGISINEPNPPYVATPQLLTRAGIDPATVGPAVEVVTSRSGPLVFLDPSQPLSRDPDDNPDIESVVRFEGSGFSDVPTTFVTATAVDAHGWTTRRAGWFVQAAHPLTAEQRAEARELAADAGIVVLARDEHDDLAITRSFATVAGMLLTLAILAMTIGLIRGEAQRDLQALTATGATSAARRTITATTAAALALLGGLLGLAGAYTALVAGYSDDLEPLTRVPTANLLLILAGLPLLAAAGGWLLAGRPPAAIARQALE
jgi:putative ABC transport system permease protein